MDGGRFDELTRVLAQAGASRRGLLRGGLAATLAGLAGARRPLPGAAAQHDPRCPKNAGLRTNGECFGQACTSASACFGKSGVCTLTVAGARDCVQNFLPDGPCPTTDQCDRDTDCGAGEVCVKIGGCCCPEGTPQRRKCKRRNMCAPACP